MTREEATRILYNQWQGFLEDNIDYAGISDAYKMAIEALKQEPCDKCEVRNPCLYCKHEFEPQESEVEK